MTGSVGDELGRLRFVSQPVETIYLNETRTRDDFIGQIGAIESFTRSATKDGSIELPVPFLKVGAGLGAGQGVTWNLSDPTAQALVLRAALESVGSLGEVREAAPGSYVQCAGRALFSRPGMFEAEHRVALPPGAYEELESDRARQEQVLKAMGHQEATMWLMTIEHNDSAAAAVLDGQWLSPGLPSWLGGPSRWDLFARFRDTNRLGIPLLAAIHVTVTWQ